MGDQALCLELTSVRQLLEGTHSSGLAGPPGATGPAACTPPFLCCLALVPLPWNPLGESLFFPVKPLGEDALLASPKKILIYLTLCSKE